MNLYGKRGLKSYGFEVFLLIVTAIVFSFAFPGFLSDRGLGAIAFFALLTVLASATGGIPFHAVAALLLILLVFYVIHYYHLENGVQRWYALYERILEKMRNGGGSDG